MIEFESQELARELRSDSLSSKSNRSFAPITLESLEEARAAYLDAHPEASLPALPPREIKKAPPGQSPDLSTYIVTRVR